MKRLFAFLLLLLGSSLCAQTVDAYGGRIAIPCTSTGWFHTQKIGNRWWLCTPAGHGFYAQMVNSVSPNEDSTLVTKVSSKYGGPIQWTTPIDNELQSWNFNTLTTNAYFYALPIGTDPSFPLDSNGIHSQPTKMPFTLEVRPSHYSMLNPSLGGAPFLTNPVKNMVYAHSPFYPGFVPSSGIADYYDSGIATWLATDLTASSAQDFVMNAFANSTYKNYIIGFMLDDGDEMFGFGAGPDFTTIPPGHNNTNVALLVATGSPIETANSAFGFAYTDTLIHSKVALRSALVSEYTTIGALNTAWGSSYTTFDSSGVCVGSQPITCASSVSADSVGTGDGATLTFSPTLSHSTIAGFSLQILVAGTPVAGDTGSGIVFGPNIASGTINYTTKALSITFTGGHAPANGAAITATYVANGWGIGTGFMDEDNRVSHNSYLGTDWVGLSNANATAKVDLNTFYQTIAGKYFSDCNTQIHAVYPNVMNLGPDALSSWSVPSAAPVLKAAGLYTDAFVTASTSTIFPQAQLDFIATNYGDKPYIGSYYTDANPDSALSAFAGSGLFSTQAARASTYSTMQTAQLNAQTTAGNFPYIGTYWFKLYDGWNEHLNWGLKTHLDNAYNGREAATSTIACNSPLASFNCGGEPVPAGGTPPFGNLITTVTNANALWLAFPPPSSHTAASCSAADVNTAIGLSSNGDTVLVPGGTCTWDSGANKVTISNSKQITLSGQGITTINFANSGTPQGVALDITAGTANNTFITGFTFNGAYTNGTCPIQITTTLSPLTLAYRFYSNSINYTSGPQATWMCVVGNGPGLIDHNNFTTAIAFMEGIHFLGEAGNQNTWTTEDVVPGSLNYQYVETNTFIGPAGSGLGTMAYEAFNGARVVFRNNTLTNMGVDGHGFGSMAGNSTACTYVNTRWMEVYNNQFNLSGTTNLPDFITYRGGSGVIFGNTTTGTNGGAGDIRLNTDCNSGSYPILNQVGRGFNQNASPLYIWGNTVGKFPVAIYANPLSTTVIQSGRDYFVSASQPTTTRCQSAADVSAGCPVTYTYTPAVYPHPLVAPVSNPQLSSSPTGAFGTVAVGSNSSITFTVSNAGPGTETLSTPFFTITGTNASDWTRTGGTLVNAGTIGSGSSGTITLRFAPGAQGARSATLNILGTANLAIPLSGTGQSSISIPAVPTNLVATASSGGSAVTLNWTASTGTPTGYNCATSLVSGGPYTIFASPSGTTCNISGLTTPGNHYWVVNAFNSAGTSAYTSEVVTVVGAATGAATLSTSTVQFGSIALGTTSPAFQVVLTNTGNATLTSIVISISGPNSADFAQTNTCASTLAASATCTISPTFTPSLTTPENASLVVASSDPLSPASATLSGVGVQPTAVSPASLNFGRIYVNGQPSASQTVTFTNNSGGSITISDAITGGDTTQFVKGTDTCTGSLANGSNCTVAVTFNPTTTGVKNSALVFTFTGTFGSPVSVPMTGNSVSHKVKKGVIF